MRSRSLLLASVALPSTFAATLYDFTPRADNVPAACNTVYKSKIQGCTNTDFTGGKGCSSACINGLNAIRSAVVKNCAGVTGNSILVNMLAGKGVKDLCPNAGTGVFPSSTTAVITTSSSTDSTKATTVTTSSESKTSTSDPPGATSTTKQTTASNTKSATSTTTTAGSRSSGQNSNGSPFYGPEALEPGVKSATSAAAAAAVAKTDVHLSSSFALAAFLLGVAALV